MPMDDARAEDWIDEFGLHDRAEHQDQAVEVTPFSIDQVWVDSDDE